MAQRKKQVKRDLEQHVTLLRQQRHKTHGEGVKTLILGIFITKMLHEQCKS